MGFSENEQLTQKIDVTRHSDDETAEEDEIVVISKVEEQPLEEKHNEEQDHEGQSDENAESESSSEQHQRPMTKAELKKQAKYEKKLAQAKAMISRCKAYDPELAPVLLKKPTLKPAVDAPTRSRIHLKHEPELPSKEEIARNRLHIRRLPGDAPDKKPDSSPLRIGKLSKRAVQSATQDEDTTVIMNEAYEGASASNAEDGYLDYADTGLAPKKKSNSRDSSSKPKDGEQRLLAPATEALANETPKERKKREKYERELAKARAQIARLPGYSAPAVPPGVAHLQKSR